MQLHVIGTLGVPTDGAIGEVLTYTASGPEWEPPTGGTGGVIDAEQVRDIIGNALTAGTNIQLVVNDAGDTITINVVNLTKATVGLGNVDNTSDLDKPISSATASALGGKASTSDLALKADISALSSYALDSGVVHKSGAETVAGVKTFSSAPVVPDASFTIPKVSGLQTALDNAGGSLAGMASLVRFETTPGVYPARGTTRQDLSITWRGTVAPPIATAGSGTNFLTAGTAMDNVDVFDLVV